MIMRKTVWSYLATLSLTTLAGFPARADIAPLPSPIHRPEPAPARCIVLPVRSVERASLDHGPVLRLRAKGTATTGGSDYSELRFRTVNGAHTRRSTAVYEFRVCQPPIADQVLTPITAETDVQLSRQYGRIRFIAIKSATNEILLTLDAPRRP